MAIIGNFMPNRRRVMAGAAGAGALLMANGAQAAVKSSLPGAPQVNPKHDNVLQVTRIERGDVDAALAASAHVVTGTWRTQRIEQLYLEPDAALAVPEADGRLHLYSQGQGIFDDRMQVAGVLGIAEEKLFVELVPNGGAFGGREDMTIQAQTALLAQIDLPPAFRNLREAGLAVLDDAPNIDFALAALAAAHGLPPEAPVTIFALARTAGWLAHMLEQAESGTLIRPRARYIGPSPTVP